MIKMDFKTYLINTDELNVIIKIISILFTMTDYKSIILNNAYQCFSCL